MVSFRGERMVHSQHQSSRGFFLRGSPEGAEAPGALLRGGAAGGEAVGGEGGGRRPGAPRAAGAGHGQCAGLGAERGGGSSWGTSAVSLREKWRCCRTPRGKNKLWSEHAVMNTRGTEPEKLNKRKSEGNRGYQREPEGTRTQTTQRNHRWFLLCSRLEIETIQNQTNRTSRNVYMMRRGPPLCVVLVRMPMNKVQVQVADWGCFRNPSQHDA